MESTNDRAQDRPGPRTPPGAEQVHRAHADAWRELSLAHPGGAVADVPGARLASSGLPFAQYNGADVSDPALVDVGQVTRWFARAGVPWAWRVPADEPWPHGPLVVRQRLMAVDAGDLVRAPVPDDVELHRAGPGDLDDVVRVDVEAFGGEVEPARAWTGPHLGAAQVTVGVALVDGRAVGTAYTVLSDGAAGAAVLLAGVAVVPAARRRGVATALSSWLLADAVASGARLAHLQPDDERAARVYARLGFVEVRGLDIRAAPDGTAPPR